MIHLPEWNTSRFFYRLSDGEGSDWYMRNCRNECRQQAVIVFNGKIGTGLGGFEPPTSGLEARRYVQAKPQAPTPITYDFGIINMCHGMSCLEQ